MTSDETQEMSAALDKIKSETPRVFNSLKSGSMLRTDSLTAISNETFPVLISFIESIRYEKSCNRFYINGNSSKKFDSVIHLIESNDISEHLELYEFKTKHTTPGPKTITQKSRYGSNDELTWIMLLDSTPFRCNMDETANSDMTKHIKQFYSKMLDIPGAPKFDYNCFYKVLVVNTSRVVWIDIYDLYKMVNLCVDRNIFKKDFNKKTPIDYTKDIIL